MSHRLIARSADLLAMRNDGYNLEIRNGYLLVKDVPYVTASATVRDDGILIAKLDTQVVDEHEQTRKPDSHVAYWTGEHPCYADGNKLRSFENPSEAQDFGGGVKADFTFSACNAYRDYEHKMLGYLGWIVGEARKLRPEATPQTHPIYATDEEDDEIFHYIDTASSRVHIGADNEKLEDQRIAIIGVGGTGSYVLDLIAKTRVAEIRLFDGDRFDTHNAFRAPGAWSLAELEAKKSKATNLFDIYSKLRRKGLVKHDEPLTADNLHLLEGINFAFICMDGGKAKGAIVNWLTENGISFIEVGMGIIRAPAGLQGIVRVLSSSANKRDHVTTRISLGTDDEAENDYSTNIQIAELNSLNAALAVIRWKRMIGFYRDAGREHSTTYQIATGELCNEECA